jgi:hypothetical protein
MFPSLFTYPDSAMFVSHDATLCVSEFLNIYLIDVVSGSVIFSISHKRARDPVHIVHSENWLLYSYFSEKSRRTEIVTLELYEGKVQSNTTGKIASSSTLACKISCHMHWMNTNCRGHVCLSVCMFHCSQWVNELWWNVMVTKYARSDQSHLVCPVFYLKFRSFSLTFWYSRKVHVMKYGYY